MGERRDFDPKKYRWVIGKGRSLQSGNNAKSRDNRKGRWSDVERKRVEVGGVERRR